MKTERRERLIDLIIGTLGSLIATLIQTLLRQTKHFLWQFIAYVVFFLILVIAFRLIDKKRLKLDNERKNDLSNYCLSGNDNKRYSVLIVDDFFGVKKYDATSQFRNQLNDYDICLLTEISDIRIVEKFDILILDILNASLMQRNTKNIFSAIRERYPEKYVVAMSVNAEEAKAQSREGNVNAYFAKPYLDTREDVPQVIQLVRDSLNTAFSALDNPADYWKANERQKKLTKSEEIKGKQRYIEMLNSNKYFTLSSK